MAGCLLSGALAWWAARGVDVPMPRWALVLVIGAVGFQLVPLPPAAMSAISPETPRVLQQLDLAYALEPAAHALSIRPPATWHALGLFVAFAIFLVGLTKLLSVTGTRWLLWTLTMFGVVLALAGIGQKALGDGIRIYGFWTPLMPGNPFGPFVNRNHFAGWMLMALPLTMALVCSGISRGLLGVAPTTRHRLLWLGSGAGARVLLAAASAAVMALALMLTLSRSGLASMALAVFVAALVILRGMSPASSRSFIWLIPAAVLAFAVAWAGIDATVTRFAETNWKEFELRRGAWADASDIASRFVVTGTGLNTYGTATLFFQRHDLDQHYAQAHNDYLQLWAEGGLLLAIPAVMLVAALVRAIRRRFRDDERYSSAWWARCGASTGLLAIALQETVEFSLQMPGNAVLAVTLCAIALHRPPVRSRRA